MQSAVVVPCLHPRTDLQVQPRCQCVFTGAVHTRFPLHPSCRRAKRKEQGAALSSSWVGIYSLWKPRTRYRGGVFNTALLPGTDLEGLQMKRYTSIVSSIQFVLPCPITPFSSRPKYVPRNPRYIVSTQSTIHMYNTYNDSIGRAEDHTRRDNRVHFI